MTHYLLKNVLAQQDNITIVLKEQNHVLFFDKDRVEQGRQNYVKNTPSNEKSVWQPF